MDPLEAAARLQRTAAGTLAIGMIIMS